MKIGKRFYDIKYIKVYLAYTVLRVSRFGGVVKQTHTQNHYFNNLKCQIQFIKILKHAPKKQILPLKQ